MSSSFDKWVGKAPFPGKFSTNKALETLKEKDAAKKEIKLNQRLFMLAVFILGHGTLACVPLPRMQERTQTMKKTELVESNLNKLQIEIIQNSFGIAYSIVNLLVTLTQISLFLRLKKAKAENKIRLESYLTKFGILQEGEIDVKKFTEEVLKELKLEPNKRYGLNAITYLLTDKEKLSIQGLIKRKQDLNQENINSSDLIKYLDSSNIGFLDPVKKKNFIQEVKKHL